MNIPELLLPAGSLDSGLAAFEGGADAVYLGFSGFSARKQARNFSREDYRRILRFARANGRRIYVTINTVLLDSEFPALIDLLCFLDHFRPDAVLFQDWGVASIIRSRFPAIKLHASTQTAMQGPGAARFALECGVSRLVLPRECGLEDLRVLKKAVPELEYEVFVHGALCYSYSGLCLASGLLLGRSGNRGECAQLCRSYYRVDSVIDNTDSSKAVCADGAAAEHSGPDAADGARTWTASELVGHDGYWFSCRDLCLADSLRGLAAAGASSLKVEGRMKAPEYTYAAARLYRAALDSLAGRRPAAGSPTLDDLKLNARFAFSRQQTEGYLNVSNGAKLIDSGYPGHRGVPAGTLAACWKEGQSYRATLKLSLPLGLRDGIAIYPQTAGDTPGIRPAPIAFPVTGLTDSAGGKPLVYAHAGGTVDIDVPRYLEPGSELARVSARELDRRAIAPEEFPLALRSLRARLSLRPLTAAAAVQSLPGGTDAQAAAFIVLHIDTDVGSLTVADTEALEFQKGRTAGGFARALSRFSENGEADFVLVPELEPGAGLIFAGTEVPAADLFVPPSALKAAKNRLYASAALALAAADAARAASLNAQLPSDFAAEMPAASRDPAAASQGPDAFPPRAALNLSHPALQTGLPFASPRFLKDDQNAPLPELLGRRWLPLMPLTASAQAYKELVRSRLLHELRQGQDICLGLDSFHHIAFVRQLWPEYEKARAEALAGGQAFGRLSTYIDFHLYAANRYSRAFFERVVPALSFCYDYLELPQTGGPGNSAGAAETGSPAGAVVRSGTSPLVPIGPGFSPPLFISRGCFIRHNLGGAACPEGCSRSLALRLSDRDRHYILLVEDCVTMLFRV